MKNAMICVFILLFSAVLMSCDGNGIPEPAGGELPTNYVMVKDSSFSPGLLTVVAGSSVTFVNNTSIAHTVMSDDSNTVKLVSIAPGTSYFWKKDTSGSFPYHCTLHPVARGTIVITP